MKTLLFFGLFLFPLLGIAESSTGWIYPLTGIHSVFGPYQGALEIRPRSDGRVDVIRVVSYDKFVFENRRVEQVWSAIGRVEAGVVKTVFVLKRADVFRRVDRAVRTAEEFQTPLRLGYAIGLNGGSMKLTTKAGDETDSIQGPPRPAGAQALWVNERVARSSYGDSNEWIGSFSLGTAFLPLMYQMESDPLVQRYLSRPEYKSRQQYFVFDKTDFAFLRAHPDVLRVVNKVVDPISLFESGLRAQAYAPTLAQKQQSFDAEMPARLNELGFVSVSIFDTQGNLKSYLPSHDGALWTGMYAATQAMRWLVTREPEAEKNFRRTLEAMLLLMDVTGDPREFARTIAPFDPKVPLEANWLRAPAPYQHLRYVRNGNHDMIQGLYYAMAWAYEILPDSDPLLQNVSAHAQRLMQLRVSNAKALGTNPLRGWGLQALGSQSPQDMKKYLNFYLTQIRSLDLLGADQGFYYGGIADWSGINLTVVSQLTNILIAKNLIRRLPQYEDTTGKILYELRQNLLATWSVYASARRDVVTFAADAFAAQNPTLLSFPAHSLPVTWSKKEQWPALRNEAVWTLREIPLRGARHSFEYDFSLRPDWSISYWPLRPWKFFEFEKALPEYFQGAYSYPMFETLITEGDNALSVPPFAFLGQGAGNVSYGRMDYLHAYWLGRLSGLIRAND